MMRLRSGANVGCLREITVGRHVEHAVLMSSESIIAIVHNNLDIVTHFAMRGQIGAGSSVGHRVGTATLLTTVGMHTDVSILSIQNGTRAIIIHVVISVGSCARVGLVGLHGVVSHSISIDHTIWVIVTNTVWISDIVTHRGAVVSHIVMLIDIPIVGSLRSSVGHRVLMSAVVSHDGIIRGDGVTMFIGHAILMNAAVNHGRIRKGANVNGHTVLIRARGTVAVISAGRAVSLLKVAIVVNNKCFDDVLDVADITIEGQLVHLLGCLEVISFTLGNNFVGFKRHLDKLNCIFDFLLGFRVAGILAQNGVELLQSANLFLPIVVIKEIF